MIAHRANPKDWLKLKGVTRNNLRSLDVAFPLGCFTTVTGVSGSGKSSLVSQALVELVAEALGNPLQLEEDESDPLERIALDPVGGTVVAGMEGVKRLVVVDQKAIGRTPPIQFGDLHRFVRPHPQIICCYENGAGETL